MGGCQEAEPGRWVVMKWKGRDVGKEVKNKTGSLGDSTGEQESRGRLSLLLRALGPLTKMSI
jgi:hypothetical protein